MNTSQIDYYNGRWSHEGIAERPPNEERVALVTSKALQGLGPDERDILDVGCGNGWILSAIESAAPHPLRLHGLEPSAVGISNTRSTVPNAIVWEGTLENFQTSQQFDVITCSEVIEHVANQRSFLECLAGLLKKNGRLVLTTPNGRYRGSYFEEYRGKVEEQPVENWVHFKQFEALTNGLLVVQEAKTFELSYYYRLHPRMNAVRGVLSGLKGGWRLWNSLVEKPLLNQFRSGLYLCLVMRKL